MEAAVKTLEGVDRETKPAARDLVLDNLKQVMVDEIAAKAPDWALVQEVARCVQGGAMRRGAPMIGGQFLAGDSMDAMVNPGYPSRYRHPDEIMKDQQLSALDRIASQSGPDPLAALLGNLEAITGLFDDLAERGIVREKIRNEVRRRVDAFDGKEAAKS